MQVSLPWSEAQPRLRVQAVATRFRAGVPYAVASLLAMLATQTWFHAGTFIATGDVAPFIRTNLSAELSTIWGHSLSGAGSPSFQPLARWPELATLWFSRLTGASPMTAQRWFYSLLALAAVAGVIWFVSGFVERPLARAAAGLIAFFNPFVLQHLPNPLPLWSIAIMAVAGGLVVRAARGRAPAPVALAGVSVFGAYLAINPPLLAIVMLWVA
ncbi:MAG: arabinofuranan 3-O-arabinosyltransferase, partial [Actinomycetota bacterium]|nr:arabinofuranan 3-O-arabinosyltransferase [Actinomycetota bacterium]